MGLALPSYVAEKPPPSPRIWFLTQRVIPSPARSHSILACIAMGNGGPKTCHSTWQRSVWPFAFVPPTINCHNNYMVYLVRREIGLVGCFSLFFHEKSARNTEELVAVHSPHKSTIAAAGTMPPNESGTQFTISASHSIYSCQLQPTSTTPRVSISQQGKAEPIVPEKLTTPKNIWTDGIVGKELNH